jgi:hypothetical protein
VAGEAILGEPPTEIRAELRQLAARLDAGVPREQRGENVLVATWNIRAFGDLNETWRAGRGTKTAREESLRCIAKVVSRFDAAAIQEVNGNIKALRHLLKGAGAEPGLHLTDVVKSAADNYERLAFVFDTDRAKLSGLACELVVPRTWARKIKADMIDEQLRPHPLRGQLPGRRPDVHARHPPPPLRKGARAGRRAEGNRARDEGPGPGDQRLRPEPDRARRPQPRPRGRPQRPAFHPTGPRPPAQLDGLTRTIFERPGAPDKAKYFDRTPGSPATATRPDEPLLSAGRFDFMDLALPWLGDSTATKKEKTEKSFRISDHFPLGAEFSTDVS